MLNYFKNHDGVLNIYMYGSKVYGTANEKSDSDYIVVVKDEQVAQDLEKYSRSESEDFSIYTQEMFQKYLDEHEIFAIECLSLDKQFIVQEKMKFDFKLDLEKLRSAISQKSSNSWVKAKKKFIVEEDYAPYIGQKSAWHSLRILDFGCQIAKHGKVVDFQESNHILAPMLKMNSWNEIDEAFRATNRAKNTEFKKLAPKSILSPVRKIKC